MNPIQRIRSDLGLTQTELARAIGVTQGNISHYEIKGQYMPPATARRLIAVARQAGMELTYEDIYDGDTKPAAKPTARRVERV